MIRAWIGLVLVIAPVVRGADLYARFRVVEPTNRVLRMNVGGYRHHANPSWYLPNESYGVTSGQWSAWLDLTKWPLHDRARRVGGIAEWPSMKVSLQRSGKDGGEIKGCLIEGELAQRPSEESVAIRFSERAAGNTIVFLLPHPLKQHTNEFETGTQMTARHLAWATEATGGKARKPGRFDIATTLWGHYDPHLAAQATETLRLLGFNVLNGAPDDVLQNAGMRALGKTWLYHPDPDHVTNAWTEFAKREFDPARLTPDKQWFYSNMAHWVVSDESQVLDFRRLDTNRLAGWFRSYLTGKGVKSSTIGQPIESVLYPAAAMFEKTLPRSASLEQRRLHYHAAKFGHWWSVKQMRLISDLIRGTPPGFKSETLPSDHGFFYAWGPPHIGMSYRMLDLFELGAQHAVDVLSTEDWLGLNHMYGGNYTWSGGQSFGYLNAIHRSVIGERPIKLMGLITPSDDGYLRLKAYSALGQGAKAFFFWTFGPTCIGTENYWSDLRSEYDGIAKLTRALEQAEPVLFPAQVVHDPVAILYAVSHDIWHTDNAAAFVEKRLTWHALRHVQVQPDFLREEDVLAGRLKAYRVLFVNDWCLVRDAGKKIMDWVKAGGVLWLSAGAGTRDEYFDPYIADCARGVWTDRAVQDMRIEPGAYNERRDLQTRDPLAMVEVREGTGVVVRLPALGARIALETNGIVNVLARFEDGSPAGVEYRVGGGRVYAFGYMPMLAYGRMAGFKGGTLSERWPEYPRPWVREALAAGGVSGVVSASVDVVESSVLTGPEGSALVLANYTYEPITNLVMQVHLTHPVKRIVSTEGAAVRWEKLADGVRLSLPLEWTDIVLMPAQ